MKRQLSIGLGIVAAAFGCHSPTTQKIKRPNILIIQPDQHRADVMGCAGDKIVKTPNLDRLAGNGVRFSNAVSASPVCCPFRATLQTGLYIHEHGVVGNTIRLDYDLKGLAEIFAENGYATGYIGKWHLDGTKPKDTPGGYVAEGAARQGWQEWHGYEKAHEFLNVWKFNEQKEKVAVEGYEWEPTWHTDMAMDFIQRKTDEGQPWCYYVAYGPPHKPQQCLPKYLNQYDTNNFKLPPDADENMSDADKNYLRKVLHTYYAQVTGVDYEVGRLMDGLKEMGVDDNTIIIYVSDHGDILGSHNAEVLKKDVKGNLDSKDALRSKGMPYAAAYRVPFIISGAGITQVGLEAKALVNSVDMTPTILDLAGLEVPDYMQGISMADWCRTGKGPEQPYVYMGLLDNNKAWRAVWDGEYLLSELYYQHLYNHATDLYEMNDLYDKEAYAGIKSELQAALLNLAEKTGDPMLDRLKESVEQ